MSSLPDVTVTEQDGGLSAGEQPSGRIIGVMGNSSAGTALAPFKYVNKGKLVTAAGYGPGVEAAALEIDAGAEVYFCKLANTTAGTQSAVTAAGTTGTLSVMTLTGAAFDTEEFICTVTRAGTVGVDPAPAFNYSRDGGNTLEGEVRIPANGIYAFPNSGISGVFSARTLVFTATNADEIFHSVAHGMVAGTPVKVANSGGALPAGLVAGTQYYVITVTADTFQLSLTVGGSAVLITTDGTGTQTATIANSLVVGTTFTFTTTAPIWGASDVAAGITALAAVGVDFRCMQLVGACSATQAAAIKTKLDTMALAHQPTSCLVETVGRGVLSDDAWCTALMADFDTFVSTRIGVAAGEARVISAISSRLYRRPFAWVVGSRIARTGISTDLARVKDGAIPEIAKGVDGYSIYHDERTNEVLDSQRFITARTFVKKKGAYITNANLMAAPGSDFRRWQNRFVMDQVHLTSYVTLLDEVNDDARIDPDTGFILVGDAQAIGSTNDEALRIAIMAPGHASAVRTIVALDDDILSTETVTVEVKCIPKGYKKFIALSLSFVKTI